MNIDVWSMGIQHSEIIHILIYISALFAPLIMSNTYSRGIIVRLTRGQVVKPER